MRTLNWKLLLGFVLVVLFIFWWLRPAFANNNNNDNCNEQKVYNVDEDSESHLTFIETDGRVDIDFNGNSDDRDQVVITAGAGYEIIEVRWDAETNGTSWNDVTETNPVTTINTSGNSDSTRIDEVQVKVKKVCASPSPTPTASPTPSSTPSPTPSVTPSPTPYVSPTPSPTPDPTPNPCDQGLRLLSVLVDQSPCPSPTPDPTPTPEPQVSSSQGLSPAGPPVAPACETIKHAPTIYNVGRIDADSVWIKWTPVDEHVSDYVVQYGLGPIPMWNTVIKGARETDLNMLPDWLHIWARVAGTQNGCVGPFGEWVDP